MLNFNMATIYLGLGTNLGNREDNLETAIKLLNEAKIEVLNSSRVVETKPLGALVQPQYLNQVLKVKSDLSPFQLLKKCLSIEEAMGRVRQKKWGSRIIDIDILIYEDLFIDTENLTIPHPEIAKRKFVQDGLEELGFTLVE